MMRRPYKTCFFRAPRGVVRGADGVRKDVESLNCSSFQLCLNKLNFLGSLDGTALARERNKLSTWRHPRATLLPRLVYTGMYKAANLGEKVFDAFIPGRFQRRC